MYKTLTVLLLLAFTACKQKNQPAASIAKTDTIIPVMDTATVPYTIPHWVHDTLGWRHTLDSFYAIKPLVTYTPDTNYDGYDKLIANIIDTTGVTTTPLAFADTTIYKRNKDGDIISQRQILKNSRFTVEIIDPDYNWNARREIIINGRKLRNGIELDKSVSGTGYANDIDINAQTCYLLTFGAKEYLVLVGNIDRCNGMGCGVSYYLLYEPIIKKAMLLQQFRCDFIVGFDKKNDTPVFIDMDPFHEQSSEYQCYLTSGKVYRFTHTGKVKPVRDKAGKQIEFTAWSKDFDSSVHVIKGNFVRSN